MALLDRLASEWAYVRGALRALRRTTPIARHPTRTVRDVMEETARIHANRLALFNERESLTYRELDGRANQYARWARAQGVVKGDVVALVMPNRPEYVCAWLGIAKIGGVVALINTNLPGTSLVHCISIAQARRVIVDATLLALVEPVRSLLPTDTTIFVHGEVGSSASSLPRIDEQLACISNAPLSGEERVPLNINDRCLYVFTSGTTGLPKAANMNHYRVQLAMLGFSAVTGAGNLDRMYLCLPMYHSTGGIGAVGAVLTVGGSCFIREKFSAREFWPEIINHHCTMFAYVGELCRYLLASPPAAHDTAHHIRLCVGNGLRPDVFATFRDRFRIPHILEFYAATEGNITLFNFDSKPGAVGRIPKWMERKFVVKIVRFDVETETVVRTPEGRAIECDIDEVGEVVGQILDDPERPANRFEGYADPEATEKKILRNVFAEGDAWFRSGDLMRKDARGYFYFIDRIGDTFRWKGENVSTTEVSEAMTVFPGIREASVYGVTVPGMEGRAGMASLVVDNFPHFDFDAFRQHLVSCLPDYARPVFLRFRDHLDMTATFKTRKVELVAEGYDPGRVRDPLYVYDPLRAAFVRLDAKFFTEIIGGRIRL